MSAKHTPGPWLAAISDSWGSHWVNAGEHDERGICRVEDRINAFPPADDEGIANARLIAAAPELLDALQSLMDPATNEDGEWYREARAKARAAIAKATGEAQ